MADLPAGNYTAGMGGDDYQSGTFVFRVICPSATTTSAPSTAPTELSTTPSPTEVEQIVSCGDEVVGDYNNEPLTVIVDVPYTGDITFDLNGDDNELDNATLRVTNNQGVVAVDGGTDDDDGLRDGT